MKKITLILVAIAPSILFFGQNEQQKEAEVRAMELVEVQALLQKDISALQDIWSAGFMVNAPLNMVFIGGQVDLVTAGIISYTSFIRTVEHVMVLKDVVVTMGSETVIPSGADPMAGQTIQRRYTNIWMKEKSNWILIARHANNICSIESSARSPNPANGELTSDDLKIKIRGNPSHNSFHLDFPENFSGRIKIQIIDINGRFIEKLEVAEGTRTVQIGENYNAGNYFAHVTIGTHSKMVKMVKL
jgi:hypothetical protein